MSVNSSPVTTRFSRLPAWLWAPCALYAISAACILIGISQIIIPLYDQVDLAKQMELFYCLIALNVYEIALIGVALLILLGRRVYDDAIALTLLIAIFLIGSSVALDTIAPDFPQAALLFGLAGLFAAGAKLFLIDRYITGHLPGIMIVGLVILLAINFLMPAGLAHLIANGSSYMDLTLPWRLAWYTALLAGLVLLGAAMLIRTGAAKRDAETPFLHTAAMHWIIAGILFIGTAVHFDALTWAFNVPAGRIELLPGFALVCLLLLELRRAYGQTSPEPTAIIALVPLGLMGFMIIFMHQPLADAVAMGSPSDPAVWCTLFAVAMVSHAWRRGQRQLLHLAWPYVVAAALLVGMDWTLPPELSLRAMNWNAAGFTMGISLALIAAGARSLPLATAASITLSLSFAYCPIALTFVQSHRVSPVTLSLMSFSVMFLLLCGLFRRIMTGLPAFVAALTLAAGVLQLFFPELAPCMLGKPKPPLNYPMLASIITLAYIGVIALWSHKYHLFIPGALPLVIAIFTSKGSQGWIWIGLSFVVLAVGAMASMRKGSRLAAQPPAVEEVPVNS